MGETGSSGPANPKSMPVFDPDELQKCCKEAGATNLFGSLLEIMSSSGQSKESYEKNKFKIVDIIYLLIYGQSQKCSWFQHVNTEFLRKQRLSETGLSALWREGVATHPRTSQ